MEVENRLENKALDLLLKEEQLTKGEGRLLKKWFNEVSGERYEKCICNTRAIDEIVNLCKRYIKEKRTN